MQICFGMDVIKIKRQGKKMNKILKKITTFFLAMSLTFSMGMAAFADEPTQEELFLRKH